MTLISSCLMVFREDLILESYQEGKQSAEQIVEVVYKDVSKEMWPTAIRNIELHLRKLREEGKIPSPSNL
jgi:hypothetical protein